MVLPLLFINYKNNKYKNEYAYKQVVKCYNLPEFMYEGFFQFLIEKYNNEDIYKIDEIIKPSYEETKLYPLKIICNKNLGNFLIKKEKILVVDDIMENNKVYIKIDNDKNQYNNKDDAIFHNIQINVDDKNECIQKVSFENNNMYIDQGKKTKIEDKQYIDNNIFNNLVDNYNVSLKEDNNVTYGDYAYSNVDNSVYDENYMMDKRNVQSVERHMNKNKKEVEYCEYVDDERNNVPHNNKNNKKNKNNNNNINTYENKYDYYSCCYSDQFDESDSNYSFICCHNNNIITCQQTFSFNHEHQKYKNKNVKYIEDQNKNTCDYASNTSETKSGYSSYKYNNIINYKNNQKNNKKCKKCKKIFYIHFVEGNVQELIQDINEEDKSKIEEDIIDKILNEEKENINKKHVTNDTYNINNKNNSIEGYIYNLHNQNYYQNNEEYVNSLQMETGRINQEDKSDITLSTCCMQSEKNKENETYDKLVQNGTYDKLVQNGKYDKLVQNETYDKVVQNGTYEEHIFDDNKEKDLIYSSMKSDYSNTNVKENDMKVIWPNKLSWKEISNEIKRKLCVVIKNKPAEWNHYDLQNFLVSQFHNKNYIPTFQDIFITKSCPTIATVAFKNEEERNYFLDHQKFKLPNFKHHHNDFNKNNMYYNKYSNFLVLQEYVISYNTQSNINQKKYYQDKYEQNIYKDYESRQKRKYNNFYDHYNHNFHSKKYSDVAINKYKKKK
ncbi:conserved Plasmodium protein, unknown function [Plasmodium reichenowi]|uniref:Uncharacterized protein n=1 Tax=Plasmodium reichenowi TaxID=5854 RepID=A0A2P9DC54_PLARE|nr:conserved Plasmodium protein, unknown function [Plasmodium reichenowi]